MLLESGEERLLNGIDPLGDEPVDEGSNPSRSDTRIFVLGIPAAASISTIPARRLRVLLTFRFRGSVMVAWRPNGPCSHSRGNSRYRHRG